MKSIVVGAMLLRTLNAQALDAPAVALAAPAAVLTPGINAPSEAELLGPGAGLAPSLGAGFVLPTGTADVILSQPTPAAPFGAGTTPGTGISFGPDGWRFNKANVAAVPAFGAFAVADTAQDPALDPNAVAINAVSSDVSSLVSSSATSSDVSSATSSDVSSATSSDVSSAASSDVSSATSSDVSSATSSDVSSATSDVSSATSSEVSSATSSDVSSATPVSSDSAIAAPIDASTSSDISSATSSDVLSATSSDVSSATSSDVSSATPVSSDSAIAAPIDASTSSDVSSATSSDVSSTEAPIVTPSETPVSSSEVPVSSDSAIGAPIDASTSSDVSSTPIITPTDSIPVSSETPTSVASSSVDVSSSTPVIGPSGIAAPIGSNPYYGPYDPYSIYDPNSPYYDPYAQPPGWEGDDNGDYDGENKPGYDDGEEQCPSWCIPEYDSYPTPTPEYDYSPYDTTTTTPYYVDYTPEAKPYQEYETTPEYAPYPTPTPAYGAQPKYYPEPEDNSYYPQLKKVRSILRAVRRQFTWPSAYPSPPAYSDDDSGYDGEDGSIPDWLYELSGAPAKPTHSSKPKCPKSCYKPKTTDDSYGTKPTGNGYATKPEKPTYTKTYGTGYYPEPTTNGSYYEPEPTTEGYYPEPTTDAYYPEPETSTDGYYPDETTEAPYPGYTSSVYYAAGNSSAAYWPTGATSYEGDYTSIPSEPTWAYEPTTLVTQYQSEAYPEQTGGADPGSPAGDYTGDTLDTICPSTCNPFNPAENFCDITTGCATTGGSKYYCACRAGFRADGFNAKDFSKQFKVAGQPYVYLAVSTSCNTPCDDQSCSEVLERDQCK